MLAIHPITITAAKAYVAEHHRHHRPPQGALFAVACQEDGRLCGVALIGRPVARLLDDGRTAEVTRLCTDGTRNVCSMLYGAARRAAAALGYRRLLTYTLVSEPGASLRGAGWSPTRVTCGDTWDRPNRGRGDAHPTEPKQRREAAL